MYRETAAQTGRPLSDAAVTEMERIVRTVEAYRTRPFWKRVVVQVGANVPYDPLQSEAVDTRFFATAGYEVDERIVVAAGSTVGNDPRFVISAGFTIGSDLYAASYASMERLERVFTDRRIYQSVDHYAIETR